MGRDLRHIATARMTLEPVGPGMAEVLAPLLNDPLVARTLSPTGLPPAPGAEPALLQAKADHWERHGFGMWLMRDRVDPAHPMIGRGGLQHTVVNGADEVEIGWAVIPGRWREGLATELALTSVEIAFTELALDSVIAFTMPGNVASRGVMTKIGMTYEREITYAGLPHVLYRRYR